MTFSHFGRIFPAPIPFLAPPASVHGVSVHLRCPEVPLVASPVPACSLGNLEVQAMFI